MELSNIREEIDKIDTELLKLLGKRQALVLKVAQIKYKQKLALTHTKREDEILERMKKLGEKLKISSIFIQKLYKYIFTESKRVQKEYTSKISNG